MSDNTVLSPGTGGDTIREVDKAGVKTQVVLLDIGGAGAESLLTGTLPVSAASLPLPTGAATEATQALQATAVKQDIGNTSLSSIAGKDFATQTTLATLLKPADTLAGVTTVGSVTNTVKVAVQGVGSAAAAIRPDSFLKVAQDSSPLFFDVFDSATLDITDRWTTGGIPPTTAVGNLTISAGTDALAYSLLASKPTFPLLGVMFNHVHTNFQVDTGFKTGNYRFVGLGNATANPTVAAPIQDGIGFEFLDTTGVLYGVEWDGGVRTQTVNLSAVQPTDGAIHRFAFYYKTSKVYFEIDNVSVGSISNPAPNTSNLPFLSMSINGAATVSPAAVLQATALGVADSSRNNHFLSDATFAWRKGKVSASGELSVTAPAGMLINAIGPNAVSTALKTDGAGSLLIADSGPDSSTTILLDILRELRTITYYLRSGLNVQDEPDAIRSDPFILN
jgi:hypothetical protein